MRDATDLVGSGLELVSGDLGDLSGNLDVKSNLCVESLWSESRERNRTVNERIFETSALLRVNAVSSPLRYHSPTSLLALESDFYSQFRRQFLLERAS